MSHLQNKSYPYQQIQTRSRDCAITRSRYKIMEKKAEPQVFYSDEDESKSHRQKNEFEDIIKQAQGQFQRTQVKEEAFSSSKSRRTRSQLKKKPTRGRNPQATPLTNTPEMLSVPIAPFPEDLNEVHELPEADQPQTQAILPPKPYLNHQVSFQTAQQTKLNRMEGVKNLIEKKFVSDHKIKRKPFRTNQIPFHFVPDYRAYFEKQTETTYEEYQLNINAAVEKAITSKVNQLVKLQIDTKHQLLKRLQEHRFKMRKNTTKIIETIAEVSSSIEEGQLIDKSVINAACASNLNQDFQNINQFLASNHNLINQHQSQNNRSQKTPIHALNFSHSSELVDNDLNKSVAREKKRKEKPKMVDMNSERVAEDQPHKNQIRQPIKQTDVAYSQKDNAKVFEIISRVNQECAEDEKIRRIETQIMQRERQERQRVKVAKKEQNSNISSSHEPARNEGLEDNESQKRRLQNMRDTNWFNYQKTNPKIKRLQILNRYHYNPFEENEGEDQCQLWKKLMSMEIKNIKSEHLSIKNEDNHNPTLIEDLYRQAEQNDKNIFEMATNYRPMEMEQKNKQQEQALAANEQKEREAKQKKSKKDKKTHKNKKDKKDKDSRSGIENKTSSNNNEPQIDDFLSLGPKFEYQQPYQPVSAKLEYMGNYSQTSKQAEPNNYFPSAGEQNIQQNTPAFNYDQLPDLQGFENVKQDQKPYEDDGPLFYNEADEYRDIEYYEGLASKRK